MGDPNVRQATEDDVVAVRNVIDGAMLRVDKRLDEAVASGTVLVAVSGQETILGTLVLDGNEITAVAVRPGRRGQGIGSMLVDAAADRSDSLTVEYDPRVAGFWEAVGFTVEPLECGRFRGQRD